MQDDRKPAAARVMAAREVLDRGYGRPKEAIEITQVNEVEEYTQKFLAVGVARIGELRAIQAQMDALLAEAGQEVPKQPRS